MNRVTKPFIEEVEDFLHGYGWQYRTTTSDDGPVIIAPYTLQTEKTKGILISFRIEGEFVIVSTVGLLKNLPISASKMFLELNDRIKLVKLYLVNQEGPDSMEVDMGFELWAGAWNKETFYSFMDMLGLGIENVLNAVTKENVSHKTDFIIYN